MHSRLAKLIAIALPGQCTGSGAPRTASGGAGEEPRCLAPAASVGAQQLNVVRPDADDVEPHNDRITATSVDPVRPSADRAAAPHGSEFADRLELRLRHPSSLQERKKMRPSRMLRVDRTSDHVARLSSTAPVFLS